MEFQKAPHFAFIILEMPQEHFGIGVLEIESRELFFALKENIPVSNTLAAIIQIPDAVHALDDGGDTLKPEGDFPGNGLQFQARRSSGKR